MPEILNRKLWKCEAKGEATECAGGAPPKSGGNLDIWSSIRPVVLYWKQYKGADTGYRVLWVPGTR